MVYLLIRISNIQINEKNKSIDYHAYFGHGGTPMGIQTIWGTNLAWNSQNPTGSSKVNGFAGTGKLHSRTHLPFQIHLRVCEEFEQCAKNKRFAFRHRFTYTPSVTLCTDGM